MLTCRFAASKINTSVPLVNDFGISPSLKAICKILIIFAHNLIWFSDFSSYLVLAL